MKLPKIIITESPRKNISVALLLNDTENFKFVSINDSEKKYIENKLKEENNCAIYKCPNQLFFHMCQNEKKEYINSELSRKAGALFYKELKKNKIKSIQIIGNSKHQQSLQFLEGLLLSCYSFSKYKKKKEDYLPSEIYIIDEKVNSQQINELETVIKSVFYSRNMINEPLSYLTAERFSKEIEKMGDEAGFSVEVFNLKKIQALRMGGILSVNKGSINPPTFNILEWKPNNAKNKKPVVLVGKGIVFDTGGLSIKPTTKSMDYMKSDMAGGANVSSLLYAAAKNKLPIHIVGLIPATENRPAGNAYAPGDIITMYDGTTVEIKNTDAEGRLILADALSFAKKYNPMLVIDIATLTGAAEIIGGNQAIIVMGNCNKQLNKLKDIGDNVYERTIELPLWKEFGKSLKSKIADLNNLGGREAQTSVAGKFLEHFTEYPWMHLDIAGVAYLHEQEEYNPAGGTGFGIRLLYNFLKKLI